jgi:hypothetical protein
VETTESRGTIQREKKKKLDAGTLRKMMEAKELQHG